MCLSVPAMGGPTSDAIPWNRSNKPKALVSLSKPSKSTRITDVKPTYAPIVNPNTVTYMANVTKSLQKALRIVAEKKK